MPRVVDVPHVSVFFPAYRVVAQLRFNASGRNIFRTGSTCDHLHA